MKLDSRSLRDWLGLGRRFSGALAALGVDALASPLGRALPLDPRALTRPDTLERLLRGEGRGDGALSLHPRHITQTPIESPSSNCRNTIFEIAWQDASGIATEGPKSLFVKQPSADFGTRLFANVIGFWKIECAFCRNLAAAVPIATPRIYAVAEHRSRFVIVMENLRERPDTRLFVNRDLLAGVDLERAKRCLRSLAKLHAGFADMDPAERDHRLPLDLHPFLSPALKPVMLAVNRLAVAPCRRRAPDLFDADAAAHYRRALDHWELLAGAWYREPLTLVHGDSHLGNFFETGDEMGLIDFQGAHWSHGIRDVQYFLINSMQPELLAEHERELVTGYCSEMSALGRPLSAEAGFERYRGFSFQTLMTAVVSLGLGSFTDSGDVMRAMLERAVAATRRLDFEGWLDSLPERSPDEAADCGSPSTARDSR